MNQTAPHPYVSGTYEEERRVCLLSSFPNILNAKCGQAFCSI